MEVWQWRFHKSVWSTTWTNTDSNHAENIFFIISIIPSASLWNGSKRLTTYNNYLFHFPFFFQIHKIKFHQLPPSQPSNLRHNKVAITSITSIKMSFWGPFSTHTLFLKSNLGLLLEMLLIHKWFHATYNRYKGVALAVLPTIMCKQSKFNWTSRVA